MNTSAYIRKNHYQQIEQTRFIPDTLLSIIDTKTNEDTQEEIFQLFLNQGDDIHKIEAGLEYIVGELYDTIIKEPFTHIDTSKYKKTGLAKEILEQEKEQENILRKVFNMDSLDLGNIPEEETMNAYFFDLLPNYFKQLSSIVTIQNYKEFKVLCSHMLLKSDIASRIALENSPIQRPIHIQTCINKDCVNINLRPKNKPIIHIPFNSFAAKAITLHILDALCPSDKSFEEFVDMEEEITFAKIGIQKRDGFSLDEEF